MSNGQFGMRNQARRARIVLHKRFFRGERQTRFADRKLLRSFILWIIPKSCGAEGVEGASAKPPRRSRRSEIPAFRKRAAMSERPATRSRPFGATMCRRLVERLGGASEDARSYWQGRFAACAFVGGFLGIGRPKNSWGVAPNPTRDAVP